MKKILITLVSLAFIGCGGGSNDTTTGSNISKIPTSSVNTPKSIKN